MHTKDRMTQLQMETKLAVLGDDRRSAYNPVGAFGMHRPFAYFPLSIVLIAMPIGNVVSAHSPDATISSENLSKLWADLLESEPTSTRAVLELSEHPELATRFLATKLLPLKIDEQELLETISDLGSDDEKEWRAAYQKLNYFDPRLAMGLEEVLLLEEVQDYPVRHRLVDVLSGRSVDDSFSATSRRYKFIKLNKHGDDDDTYFNFCGSETENTCGSSWWAEPNVEELNAGFSNPKKEWTRIVRALALLESFDTSEATAIIDSVANGHAEAQPTKIARSMVAAGNQE